jgi:methyl-accepting chemotaxis protein
MKAFFMNRGVRFKVLSLIVLTLLPTALLFALYVEPLLEEEYLNSRKQSARAAVQLAQGVLIYFEDLKKSGKMTHAEAQEAARSLIHKMRYFNDDYVFAYDRNGVSTIHPINPDVEGKSRIELKDPSGVYLVKDMRDTAFASPEGGYSSYTQEYKKNGNSTLRPKISFSQAFQPWDWFLGSGVYLDEAQVAITQLRIKMGSALLAIVFGSVFAGLWIMKSLEKKLNQVNAQLTSGTQKFDQMSAKLFDSSETLARSSEQQQASIQSSSSSIQEVSVALEKSVDRAAGLNSLSKQSRDTADLGRAHVKEMIQTMNQINESNSSIAAQIETNREKLEEIVRVVCEISTKTKVINDIVFQTRLLSFNASVEAARAGENGKGFAVVAEEVGNLASLSGKAAQEINQILEQSTGQVQSIIQESTSAMKQLTDNSGKQTLHGNEVARRCGEALEKIVQAASEVDGVVQEITSAFREQSTGVRQISDNVASLSTATDENKNLAKVTVTLAEQLREEVVEINTSTQVLECTIRGGSKFAV